MTDHREITATLAQRVTETLAEAQRTDAEWSAELRLFFGKNAGDVRYTTAGRGEPGSNLRAIYDRRTVAQAEWHKAIDRQRAYAIAAF